MRLFEILTKKDFRIYHFECIQKWDSIQKNLVENDEESEEEKEEDGEGEESEEEIESDQEEDCFNIDCK